MMSKQQLIIESRHILQKYPAVKAAWLFGSYAENKARTDSDLDIGLAGEAAELSVIQLDILADFSRAGIDRVDLVILDQADLVMKFEVLHHNQLIFSQDDYDSAALVSLVLREYFDFLPYLERQRNAMKERLLNG